MGSLAGVFHIGIPSVVWLMSVFMFAGIVLAIPGGVGID
jgi:hypothetical protein